MSWVVEGNATGFAEQGSAVLDRTFCSDLTRRSRALDRCGSLLIAVVNLLGATENELIIRALLGLGDGGF